MFAPGIEGVKHRQPSRTLHYDSRVAAITRLSVHRLVPMSAVTKHLQYYWQSHTSIQTIRFTPESPQIAADRFSRLAPQIPNGLRLS